MEFSGKVALITGGSRGIGKSLAERFLKEGAQVVIAARSKDELSRTVKTLEKMGQIVGISADVSREEDVKHLIDKALQSLKTIDILVNAAGIQNPIGLFLEANTKEWIKNLQINLIGTMLCCKTALPVMMEKKKGKIINFSGGGANYPRPNFSAYAVSKAAIVRFTEILAEELKEFNIQVNAVSPGIIKTRMIDEILIAGPEKSGKDYNQVKSKMNGGFDSPELVSELVLFLASDKSNWITGRVISAIWDPWKEWKEKGQTELDKDIYVLRRIDGRNFVKLSK